MFLSSPSSKFFEAELARQLFTGDCLPSFGTLGAEKKCTILVGGAFREAGT